MIDVLAGRADGAWVDDPLGLGGALETGPREAPSKRSSIELEAVRLEGLADLVPDGASDFATCLPTTGMRAMTHGPWSWARQVRAALSTQSFVDPLCLRAGALVSCGPTAKAGPTKSATKG